MYNSPMYQKTFTNSAIQSSSLQYSSLEYSSLEYSQVSDHNDENLTYELWGSSLCVKTKFIELLLSEHKHSFLIRRAPLGYRPSSLVYGELPALRHFSKEEDPSNSSPYWIEDFRMIWYHLEGQRLNPKTHLAAREFLDKAFTCSLSTEHLSLIQSSRAAVQFDLGECQLKLLTKLYYRYLTWPRKLAQLKLHPLMMNHMLNRKVPVQELGVQELAKIQKRYEQAHNCITDLLRALT